MPETATPPTQARILAAIGHISALAMGLGLPLPVAFWHENREKSPYVAYHALQSLGYQTLGFTIWMLVYLLAIIILLLPVMVISTNSPENSKIGAILGIGMAVFSLALLGLFFIYFLLPIIAAVACLLGKDFRYPILGPRLAKYLDYDFSDPEKMLNDEHSEHWVAAMGHFAIIIMIWGMLAPLVALLLDKRRSPFLKFQSIQALIYQGIGTLGYFGFMFLYFFVFMGILASSGGQVEQLPTPVLIGFAFSMLCIMAILLLVGPAYQILAQWAAYRILKGDNYHFPLVAKLAGKWTQ